MDKNNDNNNGIDYKYSYFYEDGFLIIFKIANNVRKIIHTEYIEELEMVEDSILELQEQSLLPCCHIRRIYNN